MQYSSAITIEEISPDSSKRSVTLQGPSLPFMGAEWGGENQMVTTWYPGNGVEATQQVLGPREPPSSWKGMWRRTMMGTTPAKFSDGGPESNVIHPHILRDVLESIFREGARLRVTWFVNVSGTNQTGFTANGQNALARQIAKNGTPDANLEGGVKLVREGRAKTWKFQYDRLQDIGWEIEFHWVGRGGETQKVAATRDTGLTAGAQALAASLNTLSAGTLSTIQNINSLKRLSASRFTLGQLEQLAALPNKLLTQVTRQLQQITSSVTHVVDIAKKFATIPLQLANTAVDFARNTVALTNQFRDEMSRQPPELLSLKSKVSDMTRAIKFFGASTDASTVVARRAQELDAQMRATIHQAALAGQLSPRAAQGNISDILATYVTKAGDTPQKLSIKFYGNVDNAEAILRANRLPIYQPSFVAGKPLVIPNVAGTPSRVG